MGSRKLQVWLPLLFALVMIAGMAIGFQLKEKTMAARFFGFSRRTSLQELTELIKSRYVDKVEEDSINALASTQLLEHLDPHSVFIPAEELSDANEEMAGSFYGIGIEFRMINDTVNVITVIKDGPAEHAGILSGDKLLVVSDSVAISGKKMDAAAVRKYFRGELDTKVVVKFLRGNQLKKVSITRGNIPISSIDAAYMLEPGKGYIRINKFAERTYEEFMVQLEQLQKQKMQSLVIDLRGNTGGLLKEAIDIVDELLDDDKLIVYTEGEHSPRVDYRAKRPGLFEKGKLVILIDETSASASEVLAGALQDWDRATIIGRRSFGKGLVQQQFQLSDGAAVRLTVARYYTPLGRNIQKPYEKSIKAYQEEIFNRYKKDSSLQIGTDSVVRSDAHSNAHSGKSFKTKSGKMVYGGGGITPDSILAFDSSRFPRELIALQLSGTLTNFSYEYFVAHRGQFGGFKDPLQFRVAYAPGNNEWNELTQYAKNDSINLSLVKADARALILNRFKSLLARQLWRDQGYFINANQTDPILLMALKVLK